MSNKNKNKNENLNKFYDTLDNVIKTGKADGKQETLASTTTSQTTAVNTTVETDTISLNSNMQYGWVCPRCGKVNAPWKDSCSCYLNIPYTPPNTTPINPTPAPNPFNPVPYWKEVPEVGDAPGWWWQYGPKCGEPILCGGSISSDDTTPKLQIYNTALKTHQSNPIYRTSQDSPVYTNSRPQTCRAKTCDVCDLLNHPELCEIEKMAHSSKIDELVDSVNGLKNSIDKKLGG